jgi:hypothetical protein
MREGQTMTMIAQTDWVTGETTYNIAAMDPAQIWRSAVALAATKARQALPECHTRIDKAVELVLNNAVELLDNGQAMVASQSRGGEVTYHLANGMCDCPDYERAPAGQCKHRIARGLVLRAMQLAKELGQGSHTVTMTPETVHPDTEAAPPPALSIPSQFLVEIQGRKFVTFHGLLALAHAQGLTSLKAQFTTVTADLALAHAVATFQDGRVFEESGDATPTNVNSRIKAHFPRTALTRAKARALRDALNIHLVAVEELE